MIITLALYMALSVADMNFTPVTPKVEVVVEQSRQLSQEDFELLCAITWAEANTESELGQLAVVSVILNRVDSDRYPDTLKAVIHQGKGSQFNGIRRDNFGYYTDETERIVMIALKEPLFQSDVTLFANPNISTDRDFIENVLLPNAVLIEGNHVFAMEVRK